LSRLNDWRGVNKKAISLSRHGTFFAKGVPYCELTAFRDSESRRVHIPAVERETERERERESSIRRNTRGNFDTPLQIYTGLYLSGAIEKVQTVGIDEFRFQRMLIPSILPGKMKMVRPRSDPRLRIDRIGRTCQVRRSGSVPRDDEISRSARLCTFYTKLFVIPSAARSLIRPSREEYPPRGAEERARV